MENSSGVPLTRDSNSSRLNRHIQTGGDIHLVKLFLIGEILVDDFQPLSQRPGLSQVGKIIFEKFLSCYELEARPWLTEGAEGSSAAVPAGTGERRGTGPRERKF